MRERESIMRPKSDGIPEISKKPFVEGIHPYTMMFLGLAYQEGAYKELSKRQLEVFDRYYIDGLTIEGQYDYRARGNLSTLIRNGFETLRRNVSDEVNEAFRESILPYFKVTDCPYIKGGKAERRKIINANSSMRRKGKAGNSFSQETKDKIRNKLIESWQKEKDRENRLRGLRTRKRLSKEERAQISERSKALWQDDTYRALVKEGQRKARERRLADQAKQQDQQ